MLTGSSDSSLGLLEVRNMDLEVTVLKHISHGKWLHIDFEIDEENFRFLFSLFNSVVLYFLLSASSSSMKT